MTSNALVVLVGVALCVCSPLSGGLAAPPTAPHKLLFDIESDKSICSVKNVIVGSRYVQSCNEGELPSDDRQLRVDDPNEFFCLAIYDRIATLCFLDSLRKNGKSVLPDKTTEFDAWVAKLMPGNSKESIAFCEESKNRYPPKNEKTKKYAEQVYAAMRDPVQCVRMCTNSKGVFNPLCSVIVAIEDISVSIAAPSEKTSKQEAEGTAEKNKDVDHTVKTEDAIEQSTADKPKDTAGKTEEKAKGTQPQTSTDKKEAEPQKKHNETPAQTQPQHSKSTPEITKPAVIPPSAPSKQTPQNENVQKNETPETAAKPPHLDTDNASSVKKTDVQPSLPKNTPLDPNIAPIDGEDTADGYLKTASNIPLPDDPSNEEISEHTQEQEDQDVGLETSELDPPLIPPNEQVEESPPVPSEKREFVPRMPSDDDTHFFGYFTVIGVICIAGYVGYHNKQKILAMVLEGRRSRGGRGRRRPSTANYRKLDCTLEEAVTSQCNSNVTHVIY